MTTDRENRGSEPNGSSMEPHPSPDELLGYHEQTLPDDAADRVREHLVGCEQCAQVVLDFAAFPRIEPKDERDRMSPMELEAGWRDLEREIERRRRPLWQRHEILLPLAAALFAVAIGLGAWSLTLHRQIETLRGPSADVLVAAELRPGGNRTRGADESIQVPRWARRVIILLSVFPDEDYERYGVDVYTAGRGRVVTGFPVRRGPDGLFSLELPRAVLGVGEGRIELYGLRQGRRALVAEYPFTIELSES